MKIVTTCIGEMGHFIPLSRLVDALEEAGHEVVMMTNKFRQEKATNFARSQGLKCRLVFPDSNFTRDDLIQGKERTREYLGQGVCQVIDEFREAIRAEAPDLVITDFVSGFGTHAADELGIPCVIHAPAPLNILCAISREMYPSASRLHSCCGMFCLHMAIIDFFLEWNSSFWITKKYKDHFYGVAERIVICNSFFGLDQPAMLPPNIVLTGPLMRPPEVL